MIQFEEREYFYPKDENGHTSAENRVLVGVNAYSIALIPGRNDRIEVTRNGVSKVVRVDDCTNYTYKVLKTKIRAIDGAAGLYRFCSDNFWRCHRRHICNHVIDTMRPATL